MRYKECENCGKPSGLAKLCLECAAKKKPHAAGTAGSLIKTNKLYLHDTTKEAKCQDDAS